MNNDNLVSGWKEIAAVLGISVRTAQRLEVSAGLPVYRLGPGCNGGVHSSRDELRRWQDARDCRPAAREDAAPAGPGRRHSVATPRDPSRRSHFRSALRVAAGALLGLWHRGL